MLRLRCYYWWLSMRRSLPSHTTTTATQCYVAIADTVCLRRDVTQLWITFFSFLSLSPPFFYKHARLVRHTEITIKHITNQTKIIQTKTNVNHFVILIDVQIFTNFLTVFDSHFSFPVLICIENNTQCSSIIP